MYSTQCNSFEDRVSVDFIYAKAVIRTMFWFYNYTKYTRSNEMMGHWHGISVCMIQLYLYKQHIMYKHHIMILAIDV